MLVIRLFGALTLAVVFISCFWMLTWIFVLQHVKLCRQLAHEICPTQNSQRRRVLSGQRKTHANTLR